MWETAIRTLIYEEQARQAGKLVSVDDLDAYIDRILVKAEFIAHHAEGRCLGFAAFYCNDYSIRNAFITLFIVAPSARGTKVAEALISLVIAIARGRKFKRLMLMVRPGNTAAIRFYQRCGFSEVKMDHDDMMMGMEL